MNRVAQHELEGDFAASNSGNAAATDTDDLGMDDAETSYNPRVDLDLGALNLTFEYTDFGFSGTGQTTDTIELGGVTIPAGEPVDSDLDLALYTALVTWDLVPTDLVELGLGLGIVGADMEARIQSRNNPALLATTEALAALPVVAVRAGVDISRFRVEALGRGMQVDIDDVDTQYFDVDVYGRFRLIGGDRLAGSIDLGWRIVSIDVEYEDDQSTVEGDFEFSGPYAGITISF